jgi:hypothetical protein
MRFIYFSPDLALRLALIRFVRTPPISGRIAVLTGETGKDGEALSGRV